MPSAEASLPRSHRWAGIAAIATAVVFTGASAIWAGAQPDRDAPGPEVLDFYVEHSDRIVAGGLISLFSVAIFVVFAAAFRSVLADLEGDDLLANIAFGSALLGLAAGIGAESINLAAALRAGDGTLSEPVALALFDASFLLGSNAAGIGIGLLMLATGTAALRSRALLPRWVAGLAVAVGLTLLTPLGVYVLGAAAIGPGILLMTVLGVMLLRGSGLPRSS